MSEDLSPVLIIALVVALVFFGAAAVLATVKIIRGPGILDRMIGSDVLLATMLCGVGTYVVTTGHREMLPVLLCIAAFSFIGSVAVSRYVTRDVTVADYGKHSVPNQGAAAPGQDERGRPRS